MKLSYRWVGLITFLVLAGGGWFYLREPEVTWMSKLDEWDVWEQHVVELRKSREVQPPPGLLYVENVTWDMHEDMNGEKLEDGRYMYLATTNKQQDEVLAWKKGRKLQLGYDDKRGVTLFDLATSQRFLVRSITGRHPIDDYIRSLNPYSTKDMLTAGYEANRLWRLEIDRIVRDVLALKDLKDDTRKEFIELSHARAEYCLRQARFTSKSIYDSYYGGSICGPASYDAANDIYRDAYHALADHYSDYMSLDVPHLDESVK